VDPHHFDAVSIHHPDADPDFFFLADADPDPDPSFPIETQTFEKCLTH
jgi:hypothetical protein